MLSMMEMTSGTTMLYKRLFAIRWTRKVMLYFMQLMDVLDASQRTNISVGYFAVRSGTSVSHEIRAHHIGSLSYQMKITLMRSLKKIFRFFLVQGPFHKSMKTDSTRKHPLRAVCSLAPLRK